MSSLGRTESRGAAIADHRFLIALAILVLNDRWLKSSYPSWVTGKLSDFAGMVVFPVVVASIVAIAAPWVRAKHGRRLHLGSVAVSGLLLASIKLSPAAGRTVESILEAITGNAQQIVIDPTDLIGIVALPLGFKILEAPQPLRINPRWRLVLVAAGALACVATSEGPTPPPENWDDVRIEGDQIRVERGRYGNGDGWIEDTGGQPWVSSDDGVTWALGQTRQPVIEDDRELRLAAVQARDAAVAERQQTELCLPQDPAICVRLDGNQIFETTNGGQNWRVVWKVNRSESWAKAQWDIIHGQDLAVTDKGSVIVAMGSVGPLRRSPTGVWSPSVSALRVLPAGLDLFVLGLAIMGLGIVGFVRTDARILAVLLVGTGLLVYLTGWNTIVDDQQFDGFGLLFLYMAIAGVMAVVALAGLVRSASRRPTFGRSHTIRARDLVPVLVGCALAPIPLIIWSLGFLAWDGALAIMLGISMAVGFFSFALASQSMEPGQLAWPDPAASLAAGIPLATTPDTAFRTAQVIEPTPAAGAVTAASSERTSAVTGKVIAFGVAGAVMPALIYADSLGEFAYAWPEWFQILARLSPLAFWLQGWELNRNRINRKAWGARVTAALVVAFVGTYFIKRHGPLPTFGPTLGTFEVLGRGIILGGVIAAIYLAQPRARN